MITKIQRIPVPACLAELSSCIDVSWGNDESDSVQCRIGDYLYQVFLASNAQQKHDGYAYATVVPVANPDDPSDLDWDRMIEFDDEPALAAWVASNR